MQPMRRGEIWTVVPPSHPTPRPAVIVSVDPWNAYAPDVIVVPLTTKPGPSRPRVEHAALEQISFARCGSVAAVQKDRLGRRIGVVSSKAMMGIDEELRRVMGL